jgi:hypothetical protein
MSEQSNVSPVPQPQAESETENYAALIVVLDGPGDNTIRPARPDLLQGHPRPVRKPLKDSGQD